MKPTPKRKSQYSLPASTKAKGQYSLPVKSKPKAKPSNGNNLTELQQMKEEGTA
jgi:hypothetical protein